MSLFSSLQKRSSLLPSTDQPVRSRLFREILDANHDAWDVSCKNGTWTFYREIGTSRNRLPFGSIVLTTGRGITPSVDLYSARGKRSLLSSYHPECAVAAQSLMDREYILSLFNGLARTASCRDWDRMLSFNGPVVVERHARVRSGTNALRCLVGGAMWSANPTAAPCQRSFASLHKCALSVSQYDQGSPVIECRITYPRAIEAKFVSSRLLSGLDALTNPLASLGVEHNRSLERRYEGGA
jgi:hypothetical protein